MDDNVVVVWGPENVPTIHKFAIFMIGGITAFGTQMLVERVYLKGLNLHKAAQLSKVTK